METKCLIHTCAKRKWYVDEYLVPSLKEQGINNILIYNDEKCEGQIPSLIKSYDCVKDDDAWHLQDDIVISSRFKELAEKHESGLVCGFCNCFSRGRPGYVGLESMWYSMPCIRIPGILYKEFIEWMQTYETHRKMKAFFDENKHDDVFFEFFLKMNYPTIRLWNMKPNMVNHIDHLLGGSILNKQRTKSVQEIMSTYWDEPELLIDIENKLKERRNIV